MLLAQGTEILPPTDSEAGYEGAFAAAAVIHDLGNLIQIATSAINILARAPDMPADHSGPMLHRARTALEHASTIVRENVGGLRDRAVPPRCDVEQCLAEVVALIGAIETPGSLLEIALEPGLPALGCDPVALRRAILNLILNAREAMAGGGLVRVAGRGLAGTVELCVSDCGCGMTPATIARVFDPLFTTRPDGRGGIGLPMVERFVRSAGGSIAIESEPGIGTAVTLRLPALSPSESQSEEAES